MVRLVTVRHGEVRQGTVNFKFSKGANFMVYNWKYNMPVKAQVAGEEIERIEAKHGAVTPQILVDESKDDTAVLHKLFEWDDEKAAEKYRLSQAGNIIRNLTVTVADIKTNKPVTVRAYVSTQSEHDEKSFYISTGRAFKVPETREAVIAQALRELREFQRKYGALVEFANTCDKIAEVLRELELKKAV